MRALLVAIAGLMLCNPARSDDFGLTIGQFIARMQSMDHKVALVGKCAAVDDICHVRIKGISTIVPIYFKNGNVAGIDLPLIWKDKLTVISSMGSLLAFARVQDASEEDKKKILQFAIFNNPEALITFSTFKIQMVHRGGNIFLLQLSP